MARSFGDSKTHSSLLQAERLDAGRQKEIDEHWTRVALGAQILSRAMLALHFEKIEWD